MPRKKFNEGEGVKCQICGKEYFNLQGLSYHIRDTHKMPSKDYYDTYLKKPEEDTCEVCSKSTEFISLTRGYKKHCSHKCSMNSFNKKASTKNTSLERYGTVNPSSAEEVKEKIKKTNLERYGTEHYFNSEDFSEKTKKTSLERYGVEDPAQSEEAKKKRLETNIEKYGCSCTLQNDEVKEKAKQTLIENYGVDCSFKSPIVQEKIKATLIDIYGVDHNFKSNEIRENIKKTNLDKYGKEFYSQTEEFKEKLIKANQEKFGVDHIFLSDYFKEKSKQTSIEKYGTESPSSSDEVKEKIKETTREKFGVDYIFQSEYFKEKAKETSQERYRVDYSAWSEKAREKRIETNLEKYGYEVVLQNPDVKEKAINTLNERLENFKSEGYTGVKDLIREYGQGWYRYLDYPYVEKLGRKFVPNEYIDEIIKFNNTPRCRSQFESAMYSFIKEIYKGEFSVNDRKEIAPLELDFYFPDKKVAIECNGIYFHSVNFGTPKDYHLDKTRMCENKGIRLIHISEWEWKNKRSICESIIAGALGVYNERIYARKCTVKELSHKEAVDFLEENHIQGGQAMASMRLGLIYNGELVQLITLGQSRFKKDEIELVRMCSKLNTQVIGGFSKLIKAIPKEIKEVYSYIDRGKFSGVGYEATGWKFVSESGPNYHYYKDGKRYTRNQCQKHKLKTLLGDSFNPNITEIQNMFENDFIQVYDSGNIKVKLERKILNEG